MKRLVTAILIMLLCFTTVASAAGNGGDTVGNGNKYGLHVEKDGTITLEGEPFYGFGLNYFGAFVRYAEGSETAVDAFKNGFAGIAEHNIPFVRLPLSGYYANYYENYDADQDAMIAKMKEVLDTAAEHKIGVIVSLMWWDFALAAYLDVPRSDMGKEGSSLVEYAKSYTARIVSEFASHPAVWGWEIGNEYNLNADLCDREFKNFLVNGYNGGPVEDPTGFDYYTSKELVYFYTEVAKTIRQYDDYRMITTGNGEMRPFAMAIRRASDKMNKKTHLWDMQWDQNTYSQFLEMNDYMTPDPIDTLCFHLQHGTAGGDPKEYILEHNVYGKDITAKEYFEAYADAAKRAGKAVYFGEFGDFLDMESAPDVAEKFYALAHDVTDAGIQIASLWQFQDYYDDGSAAAKLDVLATLNTELQTAGKQNTEAAWTPEPEETEPETTETENDTAAETEDKPADTDKKDKLPVIAYVGIAALAAAVVGAIVFFIVKKKK